MIGGASPSAGCYPAKGQKAWDPTVKHEFDRVGVCIYCGDRSSKLTSEHIIPDALGGRWELPGASCSQCQEATSLTELSCLREALTFARFKLRIPRKNGKKWPLEIPFDIFASQSDQSSLPPLFGKGGVTSDNAPLLLPFPLLYPPGIFQPSLGITGQIAVQKIRVYVSGISTNKFASAFPGLNATGQSAGFHLRYNYLEFYRLLLKIGISYAVAIFGYDNLRLFGSELVRYRLDDPSKKFAYSSLLPFFVGGYIGEYPPERLRYVLAVEDVPETLGDLVVVRLRLLGDIGVQPFRIVVGQRI